MKHRTPEQLQVKARGRKSFSVTPLVFKLVRKPLVTWICIVPRQPWRRSLSFHIWALAESVPPSLQPPFLTQALFSSVCTLSSEQMPQELCSGVLGECKSPTTWQSRVQPSVQTQPMTHPTLGFSGRAREGQTATTSTNKVWVLTSLFPLWKFQLSSQQQGTFKLGPCF